MQHEKIIKYEIKGLFFVGLSSLNGKKKHFISAIYIKILINF